MRAVNPKSLGVEARWLPFDDIKRAELRRQLSAAGHGRVARSLCLWLDEKTDGQANTIGPPTKARYRKILAELEGIDPTGYRPGMPLGHELVEGERGFVRPAVLAGVVAMAGAASALAPIINGPVKSEVMGGSPALAAAA